MANGVPTFQSLCPPNSNLDGHSFARLSHVDRQVNSNRKDTATKKATYQNDTIIRNDARPQEMTPRISTNSIENTQNDAHHEGNKTLERDLYQKLCDLDLKCSQKDSAWDEVRTAPLFTCAVKDLVVTNSKRPSSNNFTFYGIQQTPQDPLTNYCVLGFHIGEHPQIPHAEPILMNVNAPNSTFICGSQGSGKSYTLLCMLENCLMSDLRIGNMHSPVAGIAFQYDLDSASCVAEAAYLCSRGIKANVLYSRSNEQRLRSAYQSLPGARENLTMKPFLLHPSDLSTKRMLKLMAFAEKDTAVPLYMEVARRILRKMATQSGGGAFDYFRFKQELSDQKLTRDQLGPLNLRLDILESFLDTADKTQSNMAEGIFVLSPGSLTIVDLSDPFVDSATACVLFDICLSLIKERRPACGLVVALDEAHKYINNSSAAANLMKQLLGTIREQRHNATRVIIATQEPTNSVGLLDLCSTSIIHRFTSPYWFAAIKQHLGGASAMALSNEEQHAMFQRIVNLRIGESLVFAPSAYLCSEGNSRVMKLGPVSAKMKTRKLLGADGGVSVLASASNVARSNSEPTPLISNVQFEPAGLLDIVSTAVSTTLPAAVPSIFPKANSAIVPSPHPTSPQEAAISVPKGCKIPLTKAETCDGEDETGGKENNALLVSVLDKKRSQLILICHACRSAVIVQYAGPRLPGYAGLTFASCQRGIGYTTCHPCLSKAGPKAETRKATDTNNAAAFKKGSKVTERRPRTILSQALKPQLGNTIQSIIGADNKALYFRIAVVKNTIGRTTEAFFVKLVDEEAKIANIFLFAHDKGDFFE